MKIRKTKTFSITSGKGGVGKSTITANLAYALAKVGHKVLVLDGDFGLANIDIIFGIKPLGNFLQVVHHEKEIFDIITPVMPNIDLISGGTGLVELARMNPFQRRGLIDSIQVLDGSYDYMIIDTAAGISDNVLYLNSAAQKTAVIINPDPSSVADSYALIKVLHNEYKENHFSIICNQVRDEVEGLNLFNKFNDVVGKFLCVGLDYWGSVTQDSLFRKSTQNQRLILKHEPFAASAREVTHISNKIQKDMTMTKEKNGMQFFWEQVIGVA